MLLNIRKVVLQDGEMRFAGNPASAAVDARRSRSGGGAPSRSPTRSFVPNRVVLRLGRVAVPDAGVWLGSRARSKREPYSGDPAVSELRISAVLFAQFSFRRVVGAE